MSQITIDGVDYALEDLSENAKAQIASLQYVERKLREMQAEVAALQTAKNAYAYVLKSDLQQLNS
jgi:hypothetical protein